MVGRGTVVAVVALVVFLLALPAGLLVQSSPHVVVRSGNAAASLLDSALSPAHRSRSAIAVASMAAGESLRHVGSLHAPSVGGAAAGMTDRFPPNPDRPSGPRNATYAQRLYPSTPAPMGVSDLGLGPSAAYTYGTSSFEGQLTLTSFGAFSPTIDFNSTSASPDWVSIQLNAVAVNVSEPPNSAGALDGTFWIQNGVRFNGTAYEVEDNVWNFSARHYAFGQPPIPPGALHGRVGHLFLGGDFYGGTGPLVAVSPASVSSPLTLVLYDNITRSSGHTVVTLAYTVRGQGGTFDVITFNGTTSDNSQFLVDGTRLAPSGLLYDAEFVLGGNGDGSNADVVALDGTATLARYASGYSAVTSAFDFGPDSSDTVEGVAVAYTGTSAQLSAGPSFLNGLWNTAGPAAQLVAPSAPSGWINVRIAVSPSYAFLFATNNTAAAGPLRYANYTFAPTDLTGNLTADLPSLPLGKSYVFTAWADGWTNASLTVSTGSVNPVPLNLTLSTFTVDAPVYLRSSAQAIQFARTAVVETGYRISPGALWLNASSVTLAAPFLRVNHYDWPTFTLVAVTSVALAIHVNGFVLASGSSQLSNETGAALTFPGWLQGYFVYYGAGGDSVQNVSLTGFAAGDSRTPRVFPPSTVEFFDTSNVEAANISASNLAIGVTAVGVITGSAVGVQASGGAVGLTAVGGSGFSLIDGSSTGGGSIVATSVVANLSQTTSFTARHTTVSNAALGLEGQGSTGVTVSGLTVRSNGTGLAFNATNSSSASNIQVLGDWFTSAGSWWYSQSVTFTNVNVNGTGLDLENDTSISVTGGTAIFIQSTVVQSYEHSSQGTFSDVNATVGAVALNLIGCSNVNMVGVTAVHGSIGAFLSNVVSATGTGFNSSDLSVGLYANSTRGTSTFSTFTTSNNSIGALVTNSTGVRVSGVSASSPSLGPDMYYSNYTSVQPLPIAGVALWGDSSVNVTGVTATNYPFGVWANNSTTLGIASVSAQGGGTAVALNYTNRSLVGPVFALYELMGLSLQNSSSTTVQVCTFELSFGYGVMLANDSSDTVQDNNFVGNAGSDTDGYYAPAFVQASAEQSSNLHFRSNFWADSGGGTYRVNASGAQDPSARSSFYGAFLEVHEGGLAPYTPWLLQLGGVNYTLTVSSFYLPGWTLGSSSYRFVVPPVNLVAAHPSNGTIGWGGSSVTQQVYFGTPPSSPVQIPWTAVALAAAVVAVAAGLAYLLVRRRGPRRGTGPSRRAARKREQEASVLDELDLPGTRPR